MEFTRDVMHLTDLMEDPPVYAYGLITGTLYGAITQDGIAAWQILQAAYAKEQSEQPPAAGGSGNCCF